MNVKKNYMIARTRHHNLLFFQSFADTAATLPLFNIFSKNCVSNTKTCKNCPEAVERKKFPLSQMLLDPTATRKSSGVIIIS
jgi:hypothetical protein